MLLEGVAVVEPAGQEYPAWHGPSQLDDVCPTVEPYDPAGHCPLHSDDVRPEVLPKVPAGHREQTPEAATCTDTRKGKPLHIYDNTLHVKPSSTSFYAAMCGITWYSMANSSSNVH